MLNEFLFESHRRRAACYNASLAEGLRHLLYEVCLCGPLANAE
jgi:hypothetical protein